MNGLYPSIRDCNKDKALQGVCEFHRAMYSVERNLMNFNSESTKTVLSIGEGDKKRCPHRDSNSSYGLERAVS